MNKHLSYKKKIKQDLHSNKNTDVLTEYSYAAEAFTQLEVSESSAINGP